MAGLATAPTTLELSEDSLAVTCVYPDCLANLGIDSAAAGGPGPLKLSCAKCKRRFLAEEWDEARPAKLVALTGHFPPELLSEIIILAHRDPSLLHRIPENYSTLLSISLVSKAWNETAMPVLYDNINRVWDWRMKSLIRTLDTKPHLFSSIRSHRLQYSRPGSWVRRRTYARGNPFANTAADFGGVVDVRFWKGVAWSIGAGDWIYGGVEGGAPRREGAYALFQFASRCPRLERMTIDDFDFGNEVIVEKRLSSSIKTVVKLTLFDVDEGSRNLLLLFPSVDELKIPRLFVGVPSTRTKSLLHYLSTSTTLRRLDLNHLPSHALIHSLPITLVYLPLDIPRLTSLSLILPPTFAERPVADVIADVLGAKRTRLLALERYTLRSVMIVPEGIVHLVESALREGLELVGVAEDGRVLFRGGVLVDSGTL